MPKMTNLKSKQNYHRNSASLNDLFPREIEVEVVLKTLKIYQKLEGNVSCVVWDASLVLSKYLEVMCQSKADFLSGLRVLELGAGLGVVGLTAATLGAQVTITDLPEALPMLRYNVTENKNPVSSMGGYAVVEALEWGDLTSDVVKSEYDLVVLTDCVYYEEAITSLISTLRHLTRLAIRKPAIYMAQEMRDTDIQKAVWEIFYTKLEEEFLIEVIPETQQHSLYRSHDILLLKITKK